MALKNNNDMDFLGEDEATSISVAMPVSSSQMSGSIDSGNYVAPSAHPDQAQQSQGQDESIVDMFKKSSHPVAAVFHVAFKIAALLVYMFGPSDSNFVMVFVMVVLLLAFDFWTVKNVTGRLLVGLRWWSEVLEDGKTTWRFESIENVNAVSNTDYRIFWYSMYINVILWAILGLLGITSFKATWLLVLIALSLNCSNIYGYWQCSKDARKKLEGAVQGMAANAFASSMTSGFGRLFGGSRTQT